MSSNTMSLDSRFIIMADLSCCFARASATWARERKRGGREEERRERGREEGEEGERKRRERERRERGRGVDHIESNDMPHTCNYLIRWFSHVYKLLT